MAVSIDTVYQRVLAILNKEQRGYLTPQEFNLFANQAQMDIFEQYFYDIEQFGLLHGNDTEYSDMLNILNEKISLFEKTVNLTYSSSTSYWSLPSDLYRLGTIIYSGNEVERVNKNEYLYITSSPIAAPTADFPIYTKDIDGIKAYGPTEIDDSVESLKCNYIKKPTKVEWKYQIVYGEALYDATYSVNFELHPSEEVELVTKILALAGVLVRDLSVYQLATQEDAMDIQQQKS
jgi:predicted Zn-dependent protease